jgi:hypothetical protein
MEALILICVFAAQLTVVAAAVIGLCGVLHLTFEGLWAEEFGLTVQAWTERFQWLRDEIREEIEFRRWCRQGEDKYPSIR